MASDTTQSRRYAVVQLDDRREQDLGTVLLNDAGQITAEPGAADGNEKLAVIIQSMNSTDVMHVNVTPPEGAPRYAVASRVVRRGEPEFVPLLIEDLRKYYDLELRPR